MVAVLVRLKLSLLRNSLRRSVWRTVGLIFGMVYALGVVVAMIAGLVGLRFTSLSLTADVTVVVFSILTIGWLLMSLLVFGVDETVDPGKFALLPLRARELLPGLLVSGLIGSPGIATLLVSAGLVVTWSRSLALTLAAIIAFPIGVVTCFLLSRTATAAFAQALSSRKFRDFAAVALALVAIGGGLAGNLLGPMIGNDPSALRGVLTTVAVVLGWTPFGWAWAIPADLARGDWAIAGIHLVLAVALVVMLWIGWAHYLARSLTSPLEGGGDGRKIKAGQHFADRLYPATSAGAVAGRTLRYWRRDPRYVAGIAAMLIAPVIIMVTQLTMPDGSPSLAAYAPVLLGMLIGTTVAQDLSYDGSAVWLHISTGISGADDRRGRVMSIMTILIPLQVILIIVSMAMTRRWDLLPSVLGLMVALTLIGIGVGCWVGAIWQVPVPPPGANPFQKSSGGGLESLLSFGVATGITTLAALPTIGLVIGAIWIGWLSYLALVVGVISGVIALRIGIVAGGRRLDGRWPEVLSKVSAKA